MNKQEVGGETAESGMNQGDRKRPKDGSDVSRTERRRKMKWALMTWVIATSGWTTYQEEGVYETKYECEAAGREWKETLGTERLGAKTR